MATRKASPKIFARDSSTSANTYHHGDLRNAMVIAGRAALEEIGARELSLRYVARTVGVSEAAPSRHFSGKEGLLAAIAANGFSELAAIRVPIAASDLAPREKARQMMNSYVQFAQKHKGLFDLMVGPRILQRDAYPELTEAAMESFELFAEAVRNLARLHGWPSTQMDLVVQAGWSVEHGLASLILSSRLPHSDYPIETEALVVFTISLFLDGIAAGPKTASR